jgi:predicted RNase H-like HicB family nuclease
MRYPVVIERANGNFSAFCPDLPGCIATGKTVKETRSGMKKAIRKHLERMKKEGFSIPAPQTRVGYVEIIVQP